MNKSPYKFIFHAVISGMLLAWASYGFAQGTSTGAELKEAAENKLKAYKADSRSYLYAQQVMARFDKAGAPSEEKLKRHVGIAIALDDLLCEERDKPCEPLVYPAVLRQEDAGLAIVAIRNRSNPRVGGEEGPDSYVEQFLSGSMRLGATPEFRVLMGDLPAPAYGEVTVQAKEWDILDRVSVSALRQSGSWLIAISSDKARKHKRVLIYAFPTSARLDESDKIVVPPK
jgi:hypothetical protein